MLYFFNKNVVFSPIYGIVHFHNMRNSDKKYIVTRKEIRAMFYTEIITHRIHILILGMSIIISVRIS